VPATVIVGAQWGDEGKGKIVDLLAQHSDLVCRYQGGPNAGHTIVAGGETFKIRQTPSGVISGKTSVIGAGCHPLVRPNYGYFNKTLPRSAPQVVIITPLTRCFDTADKYNADANSPSPAGCRANRALIETLDKDALRAWVR